MAFFDVTAGKAAAFKHAVRNFYTSEVHILKITHFNGTVFKSTVIEAGAFENTVAKAAVFKYYVFKFHAGRVGAGY